MGIKAFTLENGMRVLLEENHTSKVISFNALVRAGSASESDNEAGICHVIEHMLFKGTPTRPTGTIARDVEAAGGEINAYTSIDQTVFYINMASRFSDRGLTILADAIKNPLFEGDELGREKEVILEEIRREQDTPSRIVGEKLFQHAYRRHPYGRPIIGFPKTVRSLSREKLIEFHRRWYTPQNIVFIAVGDFDTKKMLEQIRGEFKDFSGRPPPPSLLPKEPPQTSPRLAIRTMNIQNAHMAFGFHIPPITHDDVPALDLLAHILGGSDSSKLEQEIKERQHLVHNIYAYAFTPKDPGQFIIGATLSDMDAAKAIGAIRHELDRMRDEPVTSEELARAKLNIRSNEIYDKETVGGQAAKITSFVATAGNHEFEQLYYQKIASTDSNKILEVARCYLTPRNSTTVLVLPEGSHWTDAKPKLISAITMAKAMGRRGSKAALQGEPQKMSLKNGVTLIVLENHNLPIVSTCAVALGGTRFETKENAGIYNLMGRTITKGTMSRSAVQIATEIEKYAGQIDGFSSRNAAGLRAEFLSEYLSGAFPLFADVLCNPAFSASEVKKERRITLKAIEDQEDNLPSRAFSEFLSTLYPKHPYGLKSLGTKESIGRVTAGDIVRCHRRMVCAKNLILTVVGDINCDEVLKMADHLFSALPAKNAPISKITRDHPPSQPRESILFKRKKQQAHIVIGFMGTTFKNEDRHAMSVLNNILSGQGGRLFINLRDEMGLAYAVSSVNHEGIEPGYFAVYIGTEPAKAQTAIDAILKELEGIRRDRVSRDELERSKQYLVGTYELDLQRMGNLASLYTFNELYGLGLKETERYPQHIMAVSRDDVLEVARKYIKTEAYTIAVLKPS